MFAIHPDAPSAMMPDDVKLGCHQSISLVFGSDWAPSRRLTPAEGC